LKTVNKESNLGFYNFTQNDISNDPDIEINPNDVKSHPNVKCTYENCPLYQGVCYEDKCICAYGFTTFNKNPLEPSIYCNYKQKYKLVAFFLEFFFPVGAGHIYAEKYLHALVKFILFIIFFCAMCGEIFCLNLKMEKMLICSAFTIFADMCLWIVLQFVDILCYGLGIYSDGNSMPMI
jgi:hypothetical protein